MTGDNEHKAGTSTALKPGAALFYDFLRSIGLNRKQVVIGGEALGWKMRTTKSRTNGTVAITDADRLAMMAAALKLPAWEIGDADAVDDDCRALARALRDRIMARREANKPQAPP